MHMHAFPVGQSELTRTVGEAKGLTAPEATEQLTTGVLRVLAENHVALAVTSGPELADYVARDPDRIIAGCGYDEDLDELREAFESGIREAPFLSKEQKKDILYDNAVRFPRLSDEEIARHHRR